MNIKINSKQIVLILAFLLFFQIVGTSASISNESIIKPPVFAYGVSKTIDGNLTSVEWLNPTHKAQFYINASPSNADGYNYLYIDSDQDNLYLGIDLCSDQTDDESDEWLGIWLNTNQTVVNESDYLLAHDLWEAGLDRGLESLLYSVDNDEIIPFFDPAVPTAQSGGALKSFSELTVLNGSVSGVLSDLAIDDSNFFNVTSEYNGTHYVYRMDFDINISDYYRNFPEYFTNHTLGLTLNTKVMNNETIDEHYIYIRDPQTEEFDPSNSARRTAINTGTTEIAGNLPAQQSQDFTSDNKVFFSMVGISDQAFNTSIEYIFFTTLFERTNADNIAYGTVRYPFSSIKNYDIAWDFGPSENNASDHRIFEVKIPKNELEGYETPSPLGVLIGGYGTLISWPNTENWVYTNDTNFGIPEENTTAYCYFSMPMKDWSPLNDPVIDSISPNPDTDGSILINWNDDADVESWILYRHSSAITTSNLGVASEIVSDLTVSQYVDTGLSNGTYWYAVVAFDSYEYTYLSNSVSVTVEISTSSSTSTSSTGTSTPGFESNISIIILFISVLFLKKRRET